DMRLRLALVRQVEHEQLADHLLQRDLADRRLVREHVERRVDVGRRVDADRRPRGLPVPGAGVVERAELDALLHRRRKRRVAGEARAQVDDPRHALLQEGACTKGDGGARGALPLAAELRRERFYYGGKARVNLPRLEVAVRDLNPAGRAASPWQLRVGPRRVEA